MRELEKDEAINNVEIEELTQQLRVLQEEKVKVN